MTAKIQPWWQRIQWQVNICPLWWNFRHETQVELTWKPNINPTQDGHFRGCSRMGEGGAAKRPPLPKICHKYPTMMKLGYILPKEDPKNIWIMWHTPWLLLTLAFFQQKSANFVISRNADIDCILEHNF